jgi:hypothetical protein
MDMDFIPGGEHLNMDDTTLTPAFNLYSGHPQQQHACLTGRVRQIVGRVRQIVVIF